MSSARSARATASASGTFAANSPQAIAAEEWRALRNALPPRAAASLARAFGRRERWAYDRIEGRLVPSPAFSRAAFALLTPADQEKVEKIRLRGTPLAVSLRPLPARLSPSPAASLGASLARIATGAEAAALAVSDGSVTAEEAAAVRAEIEPALVLAADAVASLEVAAGERLLP